jgi:hypothetical protein
VRDGPSREEDAATLSQIRIGIGLLCVAAGTAWALRGADVLLSVARAAPLAVAVLLILAGGWSLVRSAVPHGALIGPVVLIASGSTMLAFVLGLANIPIARHAGPVALVAGGAIVAMKRSRNTPKISIGVAHYWTALIPIAKRLEEAPPKLIVRALCGYIRLDLSDARLLLDQLDIDITVARGTVDLVFPRDWTVMAGRVELARGVQFEGLVDTTELESERRQPSKPVIVNVQGWSGHIVLRRSNTD